MLAPARGAMWDLPVLRGGWSAIPKFVIDRRFAAVHVTSRVRHVGGPQCGLVVAFSNHATDPVFPPARASADCRNSDGVRGQSNSFVLSASNDEDHPSHVAECQRALAAVAVFYAGTAVRLSIDTDRCGVLDWILERDGCFGSCSMARCASDIVGAAIKAVAILNANVTLPSSSDDTVPLASNDGPRIDCPTSGDGGYLLLLQYRDGERPPTQDAQAQGASSRRVAHGVTGVTQAVVRALCSMCTPCGKLIAPPRSGAQPVLHNGESIVLPLDIASSPSSLASRPVRNVVLMLNVELRATEHLTGTVLEQACVACVQDALLRLTADHMDLFGRARRLQGCAAGSLQDASRIQSIADAIASMVVTARSRTRAAGQLSVLEEHVCTTLGLPMPSRHDGFTTTTPAAIRFAIEEQLHCQYTVAS